MNKNMLNGAAFSIIICMMIQSCVSPPPNFELNMPVTDISILNSDPDKYHGTAVKLSGYMIVERAWCVLWSSKEAFEDGDLNESIWLLFVDGTCYSESKVKKHVTRVEVTLVGTFNAKYHGHLGIYPSALQNFTVYKEAK